MTEKESALYSRYIIDGVRMDMTPAELLDECMEYEEPVLQSGFNDIIDESAEPPLTSFCYKEAEERSHLKQTLAASSEERRFSMLYPEHFTRLHIAKALLSRLWSDGHFKLGNLKIWAQWEWNPAPVGNMSAFYRSAEAASGYIYGLGIRLEDYLYIESDDASSVKFFAWLDEKYDISCREISNDVNEVPEEEKSLFKSSPYESAHPWISEERKCPSTITDDPDSWLIYIPFDTCGFHLGDSLLTQLNGHEGGKAPDINDPDYFIDCYEVVRELTEDGMVISGINVADGGLMTAAEKMCGRYGMDIDISGVMTSYQENRRERLLFGEVPGVIMQISDENYDYVDAQLLLQDIAYYPLGHPSSSHRGVSVSVSGKNGLTGILTSLLVQASEGED